MATAAFQSTVRHAISPYARRLARERNIPLELLRGSGPSGRIVAADIAAYVPPTPAPVASMGRQATALGATLQLTTLLQLLASFGDAGAAFTLEDMALRAVGCVLSDVPGVTTLPGLPVALETERRQIVLDHILKGSLAPLRARRLAALEQGDDHAAQPAALSLRVLSANEIRPVMMPLLPGRSMRLVLAAGTTTGDCLLSFDAEAVVEEDATAFLSRFKAYVEKPLLLLA